MASDDTTGATATTSGPGTDSEQTSVDPDDSSDGLDSGRTDTETATATSATTETETGVDIACADGQACISMTDDEGWAGPVALLVSPGNQPTAPNCPPGWGEGQTHFEEIVVPNFACQCDCDDAPANGSCLYSVATHSDNECVDLAKVAPAVAAPACVQTTPFGVSYTATATADFTCGAGAVAEGQPPPHGWARRVQSCTPTPMWPMCDDGRCWPELPGALEPQLCIWQPGVHRCSSKPFFQQRVVYGSSSGTYGCAQGEACDCRTAAATCSGGSLALYDGADCSGAPTMEAALGDCLLTGNPNDASIGISVEAASAVSCASSPVPPINTLAPTEPVTYCCGSLRPDPD